MKRKASGGGGDHEGAKKEKTIEERFAELERRAEAAERAREAAERAREAAERREREERAAKEEAERREQEERAAKEDERAAKEAAQRRAAEAEKKLRAPSQQHPQESLSDLVSAPSSRRQSLEANQSVPESERNAEDLGRLLKFVNREESITQLLQCAAKNWANDQDSRGTVKSYIVASCGGAPGIGKSTFARAAFRRAVEDPLLFPKGAQPDFKQAVSQCFENGRIVLLDLRQCELGGGERDDPVRYFTSVVVNSCSPHVDRTRIWNALPPGDAAWPAAMDVLNRDKGLFVLNIDETNVLLENEWGPVALRTFVGAIAKTKRHGAFFVTLSGTHVRAQHQALQPIGCDVRDISLPLLTKEYVEDVLQDFMERCGSDVRVNDQPLLQYAAQLLGGVPRYLEILLFGLGSRGESWSKAVFKATVSNLSCKSINGVLERCMASLNARYHSTMDKVLSPENYPLLCAALFQLTLDRTATVSNTSLGDLEKEGVIFLHGESPNLTVTAPFLLLRHAMMKKSAVPRLIRTISGFIDSSTNERETLRVLKLKYEAFNGLRDTVTLGDLYPLRGGTQRRKWGSLEVKLPEEFDITAVGQLIKNSRAFTQLLKSSEGTLQQNRGTAPFADSWLIPASREFAVWHRDKRVNTAKKASQAGGVRSVSLETVLAERAKCGTSESLRLFVFITDEQWDAANNAGLGDDVLVIGSSEHVSFFGPLLAARRLFSSENQ